MKEVVFTVECHRWKSFQGRLEISPRSTIDDLAKAVFEAFADKFDRMQIKNNGLRVYEGESKDEAIVKKVKLCG